MTFTLDEEVLERLKKLSDETMIPQAKLVTKALNKLFEEYKEELPKKV